MVQARAGASKSSLFLLSSFGKFVISFARLTAGLDMKEFHCGQGGSENSY